MFEVGNAHWQTFWEPVNANLLASVQATLAELDKLVLPVGQETDDLESALKFYDAAKQRIQKFLQSFEKQVGNRANSVTAAFAAQKEFAQCQEQLAPLPKYLELSPHNQTAPDWKWLHEVIAWRDLFERSRGQQKLDIDSGLWGKLRDHLEIHLSLFCFNLLRLCDPVAKPHGMKFKQTLTIPVNRLSQSSMFTGFLNGTAVNPTMKYPG